MEVLEYIKKFKMDQPNFEFNREDFVKAFGEDFKSCITNPKVFGVNPPYDKFKLTLKTYEVKFNTISSLKSGRPLTKGLWNAFYAIWVIPLRGELFPELNQKILDRVGLRNKNNQPCLGFSGLILGIVLLLRGLPI